MPFRDHLPTGEYATKWFGLIAAARRYLSRVNSSSQLRLALYRFVASSCEILAWVARFLSSPISTFALSFPYVNAADSFGLLTFNQSRSNRSTPSFGFTILTR